MTCVLHVRKKSPFCFFPWRLHHPGPWPRSLPLIWIPIHKSGMMALMVIMEDRNLWTPSICFTVIEKLFNSFTFLFLAKCLFHRVAFLHIILRGHYLLTHKTTAKNARWLHLLTHFGRYLLVEHFHSGKNSYYTSLSYYSVTLGIISPRVVGFCFLFLPTLGGVSVWLFPCGRHHT